MKNYGSLSLEKMCMMIKKLRESEYNSKYLFTSADLLATLYYIDKKGDVGRIYLSRILGIGEQVARSILKELSNKNFILIEGRTKRLNIEISTLLDKLYVMEIIPSPEILGWSRTLLLQVCLDRGFISDERLVWLRDRIVRWGGSGAVILIRDSDGNIILPKGEGSLAERKIKESIDRIKLIDCQGFIVLIGLEEKVSEWSPVYGFLEGLCMLYESF